MKQIKLFAMALFLVAGARTARAESMDDLAEKAVKVIERIGSDGDASKGDCEKLGTALASHMDDDATVMKAIKDAEAKLTKEQKAENRKKMEAKYGERMKAAKKKLESLKTCKTNAKVKAYGEKVMK
jgi:hypothetical protein